MDLLIGILLGAAANTLGWVIVSRRRPKYEVPMDSRVTFAMYDREGNALTERELVSIGGDGANVRTIEAKAIRTGRLHHGVVFIGEYGTVFQMEGGSETVQVGDTYMIPPGGWRTALTPE